MTSRRFFLTLPWILAAALGASTCRAEEGASAPSPGSYGSHGAESRSTDSRSLPVPKPIAEKGYHLVKNWDFGTAPGKTIRNHEELWASFQPNIHYDNPPGSRSIYGGWERYRGLDKNYVFTPDSLQLVSDIPASGGLYDGGLDGAGIFSWGKFSFRYGYIEMRVKFPPFEKTGLWPAGWLIPTDSTPQDMVEIDLFEIYNKASAPDQHRNNVFITVHGSGANIAPEFKATTAHNWEGKNGGDVFGGGRYAMPIGSIYDDFHTYAAEWTENEITFYVDDIPVTRRHFTWRWSNGSEASPAYVLLNMSCGGPYGGWPTSTAEFPAALEVQYIRIWQRSPSPSASLP